MSATEPYVRAFGDLMEKKLNLNRHKGDRDGWIQDSAESLLGRCKDELDELRDAIRRGASPEEIANEAADVGNFAMMVADGI